MAKLTGWNAQTQATERGWVGVLPRVLLKVPEAVMSQGFAAGVAQSRFAQAVKGLAGLGLSLALPNDFQSRKRYTHLVPRNWTLKTEYTKPSSRPQSRRT